MTRTQCCIVGGGPAGAMLGLLLARKGLDVVVLEKNGDFLRDFRGDTIHPSTMESLDELDLAERFLELKPALTPVFSGRTPAGAVTLADFRELRTRFPYIAMIPQWDFLNFLTCEATRYPGFHLLMNAEATELIEEDGVVRGVRVRSADGEDEIRAPLTVAADGRSSRLRDRAGLSLAASSPPIDVLWFRLPHGPDEPIGTTGFAGDGRVIVYIDRRDYWQVAYVIPKGSADALRRAGIDQLRDVLARVAPDVGGGGAALRSWDQVSVLTVRADRLRRWHRPGLLCIGYAAHAMSPVGGVGINFAIQDAVAAANLLAEPIRSGHVSDRQLAAVQRQRAWQVRAMQLIQAGALRLAVRASATPRRGPGALLAGVLGRLFGLGPARRLRARAVGLGIRRVHVA
jgi:2-polyprenyl-6-methoxyphenol hydroxylase-like FAD-dependent oxidoreductase